MIEDTMPQNIELSDKNTFKRILVNQQFWIGAIAVITTLVILVIVVWQAIASHGVPDPLKEQTSAAAAFLNIAVLVFREGLECILVLSAITASMVGSQSIHRRPVVIGVVIGFVTTIITWFIAVGILNSLQESVSALNLQAATGLFAVIVLLVVMNWFFHTTYWGGWIRMHTSKKKKLLNGIEKVQIAGTRLAFGLALLGFSSFYREGFEVVLFLQSFRLKLGTDIVLYGTFLGAILTGFVAVLTFIAHRHLPYRKMLVLTGILLGVVLLIMVGEQAQEMQLARWVPTTEIRTLSHIIPAWMGLWFGVSPTVETLAFQAVATFAVIGSYFFARRAKK